MSFPRIASWMLEQEARALLTRLDLVKPLDFGRSDGSCCGALAGPQLAIEQFLISGRRELHRLDQSLPDLASLEGGTSRPTRKRRSDVLPHLGCDFCAC